MDAKDLEKLAKEVRERARLDENDIERAPEIAIRLLGARSLAISNTMRCSGRLDRTAHGYVIVVRRGARDLNFTIAHELGHWALVEIAQFRGSREAEERAANYLAAAVLAPWAVVERAHRVWREDIDTTAECFGLSRTATLMRKGEVLADDRFVVTINAHVLRRDSTDLTDDEVRARALEPEPKGLVKTVLRGGIDEGRIAMLRIGTLRGK